MTYAEEILTTLDRMLTAEVDLTLYGRAAFLLGFEDPPLQFSQSNDVDGVLWLVQAEELAETSNFWSALEKTNATLEEKDLYISHLSVEEQVILRPTWKALRIPIASLSLRNIKLSRLSD